MRGRVRGAATLVAMALAACGAEPVRVHDAGADSASEDGATRDDAGHVAPAVVTPVLRWLVPSARNVEGSMTLCDLDHDGVPEVVASLSDSGGAGHVHALDARTGETRFRTDDEALVFTAPRCADVDGVGVDDVIVGGRASDVFFFSGDDGAALGRLDAEHPASLFAPSAFVSTVVADRAVGAPLLATSTGNRYLARPGVLVAFGVAGDVTAVYDEPEGHEVYASPAVSRRDADTLRIAIGSGGETAPGALRIVDLEVSTGVFTSRALAPSACDSGGYIASPALADLDGDGEHEAVGVDFCGRAVALSVAGGVLWTWTSARLYGSANPIVVDLEQDGALEVVVVIGGTNPSVPGSFEDRRSELAVLDGATGAPRFTVTLPTTIMATPFVLDANDDGTSDVFVLGARFVDYGDTPPGTGLHVLDGTRGADLLRVPFGNGAGTPVLGDPDDDGVPDLFVTDGVYDHDRAPRAIMRIELEGARFERARHPSGFRGSAGDGLYP